MTLFIENGKFLLLRITRVFFYNISKNWSNKFYLEILLSYIDSFKLKVLQFFGIDWAMIAFHHFNQHNCKYMQKYNPYSSQKYLRSSNRTLADFSHYRHTVYFI